MMMWLSQYKGLIWKKGVIPCKLLFMDDVNAYIIIWVKDRDQL